MHSLVHISTSDFEGSMLPLGAEFRREENAYNFSIYSQSARIITLLFFKELSDAEPVCEFEFDPFIHRTNQLWHCQLPVETLKGARFYAYRIDGPSSWQSEGRHAFDSEKVLLDPYAHTVAFPDAFDRLAARRPGSNLGKAPLGVLQDEPPFDWGDDKRPRHVGDLIIYEMHVRGFTASPSSGVEEELRGTFAGIRAKIPYLKELGVNAVELMPVQQFDPEEGNYWGYMTLNFFAPHLGYAVNKTCDFSRPGPKNEFRAMVKELHAAGIEVILDVVYNHTAEGDERGPCYSYRGIDNETYYILSDDPARPYQNHSGTGNTLNCANGVVQTLIVDSLRYWVSEMHVDGFRFDLASALTRNSDGSINETPALLSDIRTDPVLREVRLIAEPWDCGAYQLGSRFPGRLWHQWNGVFRDDVRRFVRGDTGMVPSLMRRLYGSDDLFPDHEAYRPLHSINYIISHDGFTLHDLVSYNERRNLANGHNNTDGTGENFSWNCGYEGDEAVPAEVLALRRRQAKNHFALLLLANGIPMFLSGDEFLQTQGGNNNPYNQDNETTWLDWSRLAENAEHFRFVKMLIAFRKAHRTLCRNRFWRKDVRWYGVEGAPDLSANSHALAYFLRGLEWGDTKTGAKFRDVDLYVMINGWEEPLEFAIQEGELGEWRRVIDTGLHSPQDILEPGGEEAVWSAQYTVSPRSVVVLLRG